jgi:hypothetical protein
MLFDQRGQLMGTCAQAVDVERDDFHEAAVLAKG